MLIESLRAIQEKHGYIPEKDLVELAERLKEPVYEVYGVASFYPQFRLTPPPRAAIHVCTDICCHLKGAEGLLDRIKSMTEGRSDVEVKNCSCLGQCDGAPAAMIDEKIFARLGAEGIAAAAGVAIHGQTLQPTHVAPARGPFKTDPYGDEKQRYGALRALIASGDFAGVIEKIKSANLRGMGGGGFPAHIKWAGVRNNPSAEKYIICNGDESEVGTFKDREILKNLPHLIVESMIIAGLSTGANRGYIYIRHEYHEQIDACRAEISSAAAAGLLGKNILASGKSFDLEVFVSPGGYIQGEETALLEAIEGRRGQPRNKPSIPAITGLFGKPTVINNVETFAYVPAILMRGPEWFISQGKNGCQGLKWIGVGGDVNQPGVFELPMGTTYAEALAMAGGVAEGKKLKAFAPSGPSFGFLPPSAIDVPMDFPDPAKKNPIFLAGGTVGSGAVIIVAEGRCMVDLALNFTRFYRNESCGKCVPCRLGSQKMVDIIAGLTGGTAGASDLEEISRLGETMTLTSICGLGMVVHKPMESVMRHWPAEVEAHLKQKTCPAGVCRIS